MKIVSLIARYLLGLMFTVFGLNGFLNFIHQPPPTNPLVIQFFVAISASHFAAFFFAMQLIGGLLLLSGFFVPLALTVLAAELYNILAFHLTLSPGIAPALVACVLWVLVFLQYRNSFNAVLAAKPVVQVESASLQEEAQCLLAAERFQILPRPGPLNQCGTPLEILLTRNSWNRAPTAPAPVPISEFRIVNSAPSRSLAG